MDVKPQHSLAQVFDDYSIAITRRFFTYVVRFVLSVRDRTSA